MVTISAPQIPKIVHKPCDIITAGSLETICDIFPAGKFISHAISIPESEFPDNHDLSSNIDVEIRFLVHEVFIPDFVGELRCLFVRQIRIIFQNIRLNLIEHIEVIV